MLATALLVAALAALGLVAFIGILYLTRGTPVRRLRVLGEEDGRLTAGDRPFCETFSRLTNTRLFDGNRVEPLQNGNELLPRLWHDVEQAERLITWQAFWMKPGRTADRLRDALAARARAGVRVLFLHDYFGSRGVADDWYDALRAAGAEVATFRPPGLTSLYKLQHRSHTRTVVIDGRIGYTGGFGIDDRWRGGGAAPGEWRDTSVRVEGPVVDQLSAAFVNTWAEATGQLLMGSLVFTSAAEPTGSTTAGIMYAAPSLGSTVAERFFAMSIGGARQRLYITNAYVVPNAALRRMLVEAAGRGADVRVLTPGANTDRRSVWWASRHHYEELLDGGVRLYEYRPTMVHAKTLVADAAWCCIGTVNFDNRSMALNDEVALVARDEDLGEFLATQFLRDLELADEIDRDRFRERGTLDRAREMGASLVARLL